MSTIFKENPYGDLLPDIGIFPIRKEEFEEGQCQDCGEALNNAEGTYCPACLAARLENRRDDMREDIPKELLTK